MDFNIFDKGGSWKYVPHITVEKETETSSRTFIDLCRTKEGKEIAEKIINNYLNDGTKNNSKPVSRRNINLEKRVGEKLPSVWSKTSEDQE